MRTCRRQQVQELSGIGTDSITVAHDLALADPANTGAYN